MTNDDETAVGPANDETAVIAASDAVTQLRQSQDALAWSAEEPQTVRLRAPAPLAHGLLILVLLAAITVASYIIAENPKRPANMRSRQPPTPLGVLDGTYRLDYDYAKGTLNGAPDPTPNTDNGHVVGLSFIV
jgi:hypothetical protein